MSINLRRDMIAMRLQFGAEDQPICAKCAKPVGIYATIWCNDCYRQKRHPKLIFQVLNAICTEHCNTTQDVADVTGLPLEICSSYVSQLLCDGILRHTGNVMPNINERGFGRRCKVFEIVTHANQ